MPHAAASRESLLGDCCPAWDRPRTLRGPERRYWLAPDAAAGALAPVSAPGALALISADAPAAGVFALESAAPLLGEGALIAPLLLALLSLLEALLSARLQPAAPSVTSAIDAITRTFFICIVFSFIASPPGFGGNPITMEQAPCLPPHECAGQTLCTWRGEAARVLRGEVHGRRTAVNYTGRRNSFALPFAPRVGQLAIRVWICV